mmetsp:Transcript_26984/g.56663  ORF Transcript_26984/g.56663 Transcript_26984/m.56663 type:complete len:211 (+) Transcript_26984:151-783(+)
MMAPLAIIINESRRRRKNEAETHGSEKEIMCQRRAPKRCGGAIQLKPDQYQEYTRLHDEVWPEVLERMARSNIRNFAIYYHEATNTLFSHFEWIGHWKMESDNEIERKGCKFAKAKYQQRIEKEKELFESDMEAIASDEIVRRWWSFCEPCQTPFPGQWPEMEPPPSRGGKGDWWTPLVCICHCSHWPVEYSDKLRDPELANLCDVAETL